MSKLKFWTTAMLIFGFAMLFGYPFLLTRRPAEGASREARAQFAVLLTGYMGVLLLVFFVLVVLAWRIMVFQREKYREETLQNLRDLVEGTLNDHQQKQGNDRS